MKTHPTQTKPNHLHHQTGGGIGYWMMRFSFVILIWTVLLGNEEQIIRVDKMTIMLLIFFYLIIKLNGKIVNFTTEIYGI